MKDATYKEVEQLLERVVDIMQRERVKGCFPQGYKCSLPDALPEWLGYGYNETQVRSAVPTAKEITFKNNMVYKLYKLRDVKLRKVLTARATASLVGESWEEIRIKGKWYPVKLKKIKDYTEEELYNYRNFGKKATIRKLPAIMTLQRWHNTAMRNFIRILTQQRVG